MTPLDRIIQAARETIVWADGWFDDYEDSLPVRLAAERILAEATRLAEEREKIREHLGEVLSATHVMRLLPNPITPSLARIEEAVHAILALLSEEPHHD
jgi:hypothetical protein